MINGSPHGFLTLKEAWGKGIHFPPICLLWWLKLLVWWRSKLKSWAGYKTWAFKEIVLIGLPYRTFYMLIDDTLLYLREILEILRQLWLKVNLAKRSIFSINADDLCPSIPWIDWEGLLFFHVVKELADILGCKAETFLTVSLGLPWGRKGNDQSIWNKVDTLIWLG